MPNTVPVQPESYLPQFGVDRLVASVATLIGAEEDPDVRSLATEFLDRAADNMNMAGVFLDRRAEAQYSNFAVGQQYIELPSDWGWPAEEQAWLADVDGVKTQVITWVTWEYFSSLAPSSSAMGPPVYIALRSDLNDGKAYIWPAHPGPDYEGQIILPYYARVQRPSDVGEINVSPEVKEALLVGAQAFMIQHRYKTQPGVWKPWMDQFTQAITKAKAAVARHQQAHRTLMLRTEFWE